MCAPAPKLISVTTSGKQCGPQVASVPFDRRTSGVSGGELGDELGGLLVGGRELECEVEGCGAADVDAARFGDVDADLLGRAEVEAVGEGVRVRVAEVDVDGCPVGVGDGDPELTAPGEPSGAFESSTGLLANAADRSTGCPPPPRSSSAAPPAPSRQTRSTSTATRPTETAAAGPVSSPAKNAPQPAQTN